MYLIVIHSIREQKIEQNLVCGKSASILVFSHVLNSFLSDTNNENFRIVFVHTKLKETSERKLIPNYIPNLRSFVKQI